MKKVRIALKTLPYAGRYGKYRPHSLIDVDVDEARALVEAGHATYAGPPPAAEIETAVAKPVVQKAAVSKPRPEPVAEKREGWLEKVRKENEKESR